MAMTKCRECKKDISNKAEACPHCGAPVAKQKKGSGVGCGTVIVIAIVLAIVGGQISEHNAERERQAQKQRAEAQAQKAAEARQAAIEQFRKDPTTTLKKARSLSQEQRWPEVVALLEPLLPAENEDAQNLYEHALESKLVAELARIPASDAKANYERYDRLTELRPDNATYAQKRDRYKANWDEQQAKELAEKLLFGNTPQQSPWDGSYPEVKAYLKSTAHDPDSIEFVGCTEVFKNDAGWVIGCEYRGSNAFGAKILTANWFRIQRGQVVQVYDEDAFRWP